MPSGPISHTQSELLSHTAWKRSRLSSREASAAALERASPSSLSDRSRSLRSRDSISDSLEVAALMLASMLSSSAAFPSPTCNLAGGTKNMLSYTPPWHTSLGCVLTAWISVSGGSSARSYWHIVLRRRPRSRVQRSASYSCHRSTPGTSSCVHFISLMTRMAVNP